MLPMLLLSMGCGPEKSLSPEAARGKAVYQSNCTACHNADPAQVGAVGPAIAGSSRALIEARVMTASYPDGYKPKRETNTMQALPHLASSIDDLTAFVNTP